MGGELLVAQRYRPAVRIGAEDDCVALLASEQMGAPTPGAPEGGQRTGARQRHAEDNDAQARREAITTARVAIMAHADAGERVLSASSPADPCVGVPRPVLRGRMIAGPVALRAAPAEPRELRDRARCTVHAPLDPHRRAEPRSAARSFSSSTR